ncbi:MAG: hypothetical protein KDJ35_08340 [Alphaproteobacteria bacterium]|nr:hypothetical protein [Alphaproteobacteria bacterium]
MLKSRRQIITIPLSERTYTILDKISFAKKQVPQGAHTDTHAHRFFSAYLVKNMEALKLDHSMIPMPRFGLVIVLPFVNHTWLNIKGNSNDCYVSDLSPAHGEHLIYKPEA